MVIDKIIDFYRKKFYIFSMKYFKYVIILILVFVLLYFFFQNVDFDMVFKIIKNVNPIYIVIFLFGLYTQFYVRAFRWGILFRPYKKNISILNLYHYTLIGMLINIVIPGRVGEPTRGILIAKEEGVKSGTGLATIVVERMIDFLMIIVLFFVSLLFIDSGRSKFLGELKSVAVLLVPVVIAVFLMFYLINIPAVYRLTERVLRFIFRLVPERSRGKVTDFFLNFIEGLKMKLGFWDSVKLLFYSVLVWVYLVPFYWFLMQGFRFGSSVSLLDSVPYFSLIVMSAAIPTPGMAGSLDAASKHGLLELYKNQAGQSVVSVNEAAAFTILVHALIIMVIMIPGFISFYSKGLKLSSVKNKGKKDDLS